jgi:hypothetical protein
MTATSMSLVRFAGVILAAAAFSGTIAIANVPDSSRPAPQGVQEEMTAAAPAAVGIDTKARKRPHCNACGVIQAIRRVDAADGHAPTYEITIRLRDGSTRTNSNATPGNWRAGDRIMLINGTRATPVPAT